MKELSLVDLAAVNGGLFGPLDLIIGPLQAHEDHRQACRDAKHWEQNARQPGADDGVKNYAKYKRQFCPRPKLF